MFSICSLVEAKKPILAGHLIIPKNRKRAAECRCGGSEGRNSNQETGEGEQLVFSSITDLEVARKKWRIALQTADLGHVGYQEIAAHGTRK